MAGELCRYEVDASEKSLWIDMFQTMWTILRTVSDVHILANNIYHRYQAGETPFDTLLLRTLMTSTYFELRYMVWSGWSQTSSSPIAKRMNPRFKVSGMNFIF